MRKQNHALKACCASFYQNDVVRLFLGDVLHPGGLGLTEHLGQTIGLSPADSVLDIACGRGVSAVHLARKFGCRVTGIDYGENNVAAAGERAETEGVAHLAVFHPGDAEVLPFEDSCFDAIISECSYCTFPDKARAAGEMFRVLRPGGRVGITDMVMNGALPGDIRSVLSWVACIGGAGSSDEYISQLRNAGFTGFILEDKSTALIEMVNNMRSKLLAVELAAGLRKMDPGGFDPGKAVSLARSAADLIETGVIGYMLITARKAISG